MSRSASLASGLLLLLALLVGAAWGAQRLDLTRLGIGERSVFAADGGGICYYTPGHLYAPPTAAEIEQVRATAPDWSQICVYDPSRGFGAFPTAGELSATRAALGAHGTMDPAWAWAWTLSASLGLGAIGHGLLVNSLSIFNPAFIAAGWWLLLPERALAEIGWLSALPLGVAAIGLVSPRYLRRRQRIEAMRRTPRPWLTPKRVAIATAGWMTTFAVLAAVYPNVGKLLPLPGLIGERPGVTAAGPKRGGGPAPVLDAVAEIAAAQPGGGAGVPSALPPMPLPGEAAQAGAGGAKATLSSPFMPNYGAHGPVVQGGAAAGGAAESAAAPVQLALSESPNAATVSVEAIRNAFPPNVAMPVKNAETPGGTTAAAAAEPANPVETAASEMPAKTEIPVTAETPAKTEAPETMGTPAAEVAVAAPTPAPVVTPPVVAETPVVPEARGVIAATPIITPDYPLPTGPAATLPASTAVASLNTGTPAAVPAGGPAPPAASTPAPADEAAEEPEAPVQPVPEPGTLGLFGLGALALLRRRRN